MCRFPAVWGRVRWDLRQAAGRLRKDSAQSMSAITLRKAERKKSGVPQVFRLAAFQMPQALALAATKVHYTPGVQALPQIPPSVPLRPWQTRLPG